MIVINGRKYLGGIKPPKPILYKDDYSQQLFENWGILRGSYESIKWRHRINSSHGYRRDYTQYFINWYHKRYKIYISEEFLDKVIEKHKEKFDRYSSARNEADTVHVNRKFNEHFIKASFTPINMKTLEPVDPYYCSCGKLIGSSYIKSNSKDWFSLEENWLDDWPKDFKNLKERWKSEAIYDMKYNYNWIVNTYREGESCGSKNCEKVANYLKNNLGKRSDWREKHIRPMIPSKKVLEGQHPKYRGVFALTRYLDFVARYEKANDSANRSTT